MFAGWGDALKPEMEVWAAQPRGPQHPNDLNGVSFLNRAPKARGEARQKLS